MSTRIRENLGGLAAASSKTTNFPSNKPQIGKVYGVITTENTPTKELFEEYGGYSGAGTIFYLDYNQSTDITNPDLATCKRAKPFHSHIQKYPLIGELVQIVDASSPGSQISSGVSQKYYTGTINIWNNVQQNSPSPEELGKTFIESADIKNLISFEGDTIYQGRKGNGIRFGSTVKSFSNLNEWSSVGDDGDPILILTNGYAFTDSEGKTHVEEINKEKSSIYMTSTQKIPLQPGALIKNPFISALSPNEYYNPQIILNSDRITLNSKKDEVLVYSKSNIELNTDNLITLNAGEIIHLNISNSNPDTRVLLGTGPNGEIPFEPLLLGGQTHDLLVELLETLKRLGGFLASAVVPSPEGSTPVPNCNAGGVQLINDISNLTDKLSTITSDKIYTI